MHSYKTRYLYVYPYINVKTVHPLSFKDKLLTVDGEEIVTNLSNNPTKRNEENDDEIEESLTKQKPIDDPDETAEERNIDVQHQSEVEENIATHENPGNSTEDCPEIEDISKKLSGKRRHKNPKQGQIANFKYSRKNKIIVFF